MARTKHCDPFQTEHECENYDVRLKPCKWLPKANAGRGMCVVQCESHSLKANCKEIDGCRHKFLSNGEGQCYRFRYPYDSEWHKEHKEHQKHKGHQRHKRAEYWFNLLKSPF